MENKQREIPTFDKLAIDASSRMLWERDLEKAKGGIDLSDRNWPIRILVSFVENEERKNHCLTVGHCARILGEALNKKGKNLDPNFLFQLGVLHDLGNYPRIEKQVPWHILKGVIILASLGFKRHAEVLAHMTPIAEGLRFYRGDDWQRQFPYVDRPQTLEEKILTVVDHMVTPGGEIVSLEQRLKDIRARYQEGNPVRDIVNAGWPTVGSAQKEIMRMLGLDENGVIELLQQAITKETRT